MTTIRQTIPAVLLALLSAAPLAGAQAGGGAGFDAASADVAQRLDEAVAELDALREELATEKIPMSRELGRLEAELSAVRLEYRDVSRLVDGRIQDTINLRNEIKTREDETTYLSNLLSQFKEKYESYLHIAEEDRYAPVLEAADAALDDRTLDESAVYAAQIAVVDSALDRLEAVLGGERFEGTAADTDGLVKHGAFVMVGASALFRSDDGTVVGTAERVGDQEPTVLAFATPELAAMADTLVRTGSGLFPFDPTLGNAHKIEATEETLWEHIQKGGAVMVPIFAMAAAAFLVALYKWLRLAFLRRPGRKQVPALLEALGRRDHEAARARAAEIRGPVGVMLQNGVEHLHEPRDLIEEVMYEDVLKTRLKVEGLLPFISICAASAPLLGLLGTVTGIISTFKLITLFGSGDAKTLSGGISEALITTEFGLIVAIPSLLMHAFLSRKARGVIHQMEAAGVALVNQISKTPRPADEPTDAAPDAQVGTQGGRAVAPTPEGDVPRSEEPDDEQQPVSASRPAPQPIG